MKIAILTTSSRTNYGGILQCYVLQTVLRRMGHEVEVVKWSDSYVFSFCDILGYMYKKIINRIRGKKEYVWVRLRTYIIHRRIIRFIVKNIKFTDKRYNDRTALEHLSDSEFDVFIVGSDQVWRKEYACLRIELYYLSFLKGGKKKRIAYSASFGVDYKEYPPELITKCGELFSLFDAVSVREDSGLNLIEDYQWRCKRDCIQTLDPTMLLNKDDYKRLFHLNMERYATNIFAYLLDIQSEANCILEHLAIEKKLKIVKVQSIDAPITGYRSLFAAPSLSPIQWMEHIASSQFVITDSFHGCVYSILFHKSFIVVGNAMRGNTRISSLLRLVQLEDRLVSSLADFEQRKKILLSFIDYEKVESILDENRALSLEFIKASIN